MPSSGTNSGGDNNVRRRWGIPRPVIAKAIEIAAISLFAGLVGLTAVFLLRVWLSAIHGQTSDWSHVLGQSGDEIKVKSVGDTHKERTTQFHGGQLPSPKPNAKTNFMQFIASNHRLEGFRSL